MAGFDLPIRAIREQVSSAVDLIVQLTRLRDGTRRVTHITEVEGMEGDKITLQDIFLFDFSAGVGANGRHQGALQPTGVRPGFSERLEDTGRSEEHTSELQSLMRISYAVFCLKKKKPNYHAK